MPVATVVSKRVNQLVALAMVIYLSYAMYAQAGYAQRGVTFRSSLIRIRLTTHGGPANVSEFGLLKDGCELPLDGTFTTGVGVARVQLERETEANGYFFVVEGGAAAADRPLAWAVEAARGDGWDLVGASAWRFNADCSADLFPQLPTTPTQGFLAERTETTGEGGLEVKVDMRPPMRLWLPFEATYGTAVLCLVGCVLAGLLRREKMARTVLVLMLAVFSTIDVLRPAWLLFSKADEREAASTALWLPADLVLLVGLAFFEHQLVRALLLYSFVGLASEVSREFLYEFGGGRIAFRILRGPYVVTLAVVIVVLAFRARAMSHARRLVARDKARYDAMWAAVSTDPVNGVWLVELQAEVARIQAMLPTGLPRQFNRQQQSSATTSHSASRVQWLTTSLPNRKLRATVSSLSAAFISDRVAGVPGTLDRRRGLDSLDQLYVQATCLHPVLLERVQAWAAASGGLFPLVTPGQGGPLAFVRWADVRDGEGVGIRWGCVKRVQRAVEKVVRSYSQV